MKLTNNYQATAKELKDIESGLEWLRSKPDPKSVIILNSEFTECPDCGCIWGFDEIQFQECDACIYPDEPELFGDERAPDLSGQGNTFGILNKIKWN